MRNPSCITLNHLIGSTTRSASVKNIHRLFELIESISDNFLIRICCDLIGISVFSHKFSLTPGRSDRFPLSEGLYIDLRYDEGEQMMFS